MKTNHRPDPKLIATYFNFSPVRGLSVWADEEEELLDPFFSKFACQTCGSELAGNRYYCDATIGKKPTNPRERLEICTDCYEYFFT